MLLSEMKVYKSYFHTFSIHSELWGNFVPHGPLNIFLINLSQKLCLPNPARFLNLQDVILLDSHSESDVESSASEQQLEETVVETTEIMVC